MVVEEGGELCVAAGLGGGSVPGCFGPVEEAEVANGQGLEVAAVAPVGDEEAGGGVGARGLGGASEVCETVVGATAQ